MNGKGMSYKCICNFFERVCAAAWTWNRSEPMKCEKCPELPTNHYTEIILGVKNELHYCDAHDPEQQAARAVKEDAERQREVDDAPVPSVVHGWGENDTFLCGTPIERSIGRDSASDNIERITCPLCAPAKMRALPRTVYGRFEGPPSHKRRGVKVAQRCPRVDAFLHDIELVSRKHGMTLRPEAGLGDGEGAFVVIKVRVGHYQTTEAGEKLMNASVDGESFGIEPL